MKNIDKLEFRPLIVSIIVLIVGILVFAGLALLISFIAGINYYSITRSIGFWLVTLIISLWIAYIAGSEANEYQK